MLRRMMIVGVTFAFAACADSTTNPRTTADPSPEAVPSQATAAKYTRILTAEQTESRAKGFAGQARASKIPSPVGKSAYDVSNVCALWVVPGAFNLDYTGRMHPQTGQLSLQATACGTYETFSLDPYSASWTSNNPSVISAGPGGFVSAVGAAGGSAVICASVASRQSCSSGMALGAPYVARVEVNPTSATVVHGQTVQLAAQAYDQYNYPLAGPSFTWSSSAPSVATVNGAGLVTGIAYGSATMSACNNGQCGQASIGVDPFLVSINGPSVSSIVRLPGTVRTWTAVAIGGPGGYTYSWRVRRPDGWVAQLGTGSSQSIHFDCIDNGVNEIEVTVRSGTLVDQQLRPQMVEIPPFRCEP